MSIETEISALKFKVNKVLEEKKYVFYMNTASLTGDLSVAGTGSIFGNFYVSGNTFLGNNNSDVLTIAANTTASNISSSNYIGWGNKIVRPYGVFSDTTTQTASSTTTAYSFKANTTEESLGVSVVSGTLFKVDFPGIYNIQFSTQVQKNSANAAEAEIWLAITGTNVPRSNTATWIAGSNSKSVAAWNFVHKLNAGEYIELKYRVGDTGITFPYITSSTSPARPEIPSLILTITQV